MDTAAYGLLAHPDQWARCRHEGTTLNAAGGVQLTWPDLEPPGDAPAPPPRPAALPPGLAFDRWANIYRSWPDADRVSVQPPATSALRAGELDWAGVFSRPSALAIDTDQRLYVAEDGGARIAVVDLWAQRPLCRTPMAARAHRRRRAVDLASRGCDVLILTRWPESLLVLAGRRVPLPGPALVRPGCSGAVRATRLTVTPDGTVLVLWTRSAGRDPIIATAAGRVVLTVAGAVDVIARADGGLAVACTAGRGVRRFAPADSESVTSGLLEVEPLSQNRFDGGSIGEFGARLCCTSTDGIAWTGRSAVRYAPAGRVVTYRLDSGAYRTRWGRVFLDACVPAGTGVTVRCLTSDEDDVENPIAPQPPARGVQAIRRPDLTPPLPPLSAVPDPDETPPPPPIFERPTGRELPWAQIPAGDRFETFETPVDAPPGRYLWLLLGLSGTTALTPRVREIRVERPGHRMLNHLPRAWSRDETDAAFLHRFLTPLDGLLREIDCRAVRRELLIDPAATPQEALAWLAGFAGLALDRRWPEPSRRTLIAEVYSLFSRRGTLDSLTRMLEIFLGHPPVIIERWRLRGIPGAVLGAAPGSPDAGRLGRGIRAGGALGALAGPAAQNGYATAAHRFTVLIPADLTTEQRDVVESILATSRPAHTAVEICELGLGMRIGQHLHIELTSVVGAGSRWGPAVVGRSEIGGDGVVGVPSAGSRLDDDTSGGFRVG
jgi:phage tail-like protein